MAYYLCRNGCFHLSVRLKRYINITFPHISQNKCPSVTKDISICTFDIEIIIEISNAYPNTVSNLCFGVDRLSNTKSLNCFPWAQDSVCLTCVCPTTLQPVPGSVGPPWWRWRHSFLFLTLSDEGSPHTVEPACRKGAIKHIREKKPQSIFCCHVLMLSYCCQVCWYHMVFSANTSPNSGLKSRAQCNGYVTGIQLHVIFLKRPFILIKHVSVSWVSHRVSRSKLFRQGHKLHESSCFIVHSVS